MEEILTVEVVCTFIGAIVFCISMILILEAGQS